MDMKFTKRNVLFKLLVFIAVYVSDTTIKAEEEWEIDQISCEIQCKNGDMARSAFKNIKVKGDRCGLDYDKPNTPRKDILPDIRWCCRERDSCYHECEKTFRECEDSFGDCVKRHCTSKDCEEETEERFLSQPTCTSYISAQQLACTCGHDVDKEFERDNTKKRKYKAVERGSPDSKEVYIMPVDADEEAYIREHKISLDRMAHKRTPTRGRAAYQQMHGDDMDYGQHDEL